MDNIKTTIEIIAQAQDLLRKYPAHTSNDELIVYHHGEIVYRETHPNTYTVRLAREVCKQAPRSFSMLAHENHYVADGLIEVQTSEDDNEWCGVEPVIGDLTKLTITSFGQINEREHYKRVDAVREALKRDGYEFTQDADCEVEITIQRRC